MYTNLFSCFTAIPVLVCSVFLMALTLGCDICDNDRTPPELLIQQVAITADQALLENFARYTVTGITTPLPQLPDVAGLSTPGYLSVEDLDADGIVEIICTSLLGASGDRSVADGAVAVFTWDGIDPGTWNQHLVNETFAFPNETVVRDMDLDGDLDIMVMDNFIFGDFPGGIYYLDNQGGDITLASNWIKKDIYVDADENCTFSYHRVIFLDLDGDGVEDFITTKLCFQNYIKNEQYTWLQWFKQVSPGVFSGPYTIGEGAGFVFSVADIDRDGDQDILAPQFFITNPFIASLVKGGPCGDDTRGDSLRWFENPGLADMSGTWKSYTIDNWYTSLNPLGKVFEVVETDIQNDGITELVISTHNHQEGVWPSGIFLLEIPDDPTMMENWMPVTIDAGDPELNPRDEEAVADDVYAVDRPGGPSSQGSPGLVRVRDITGDELPDIVVSGDGKGAIYYYQNEGISGSTLSFSRVTLYEDRACIPSESRFGDIDNDGLVDIVSAIYDTSVDKSDKSTRSGSIFLFKQKSDQP